MAIANLLVPSASIPQSDFSWVNSIGDSVTGAITNHRKDKSFGRLADMIEGQGQAGITPQQQPSGGILSRLATQPAPENYSAPVLPVERRPLPDTDVYRSFIDTVRGGGVNNPYALSAVAATGRAESGFSPENVNRTWSDPSQSGQAGTAGGIMSWRNERLNNLASYAATKGERPDAISPQTQAEFFLREDPELIAKLNSAGSVEEAQSLMNNAWKFAGYDQPGGEAARRRALASNYYAQEFGGQPSAAGQAIEAATSGPTQPVQPAAFLPGQAAPAAAGGAPGLPGLSSSLSGLSSSQIADLVRDRNTREIGLQLWQQKQTGSNNSPFHFMSGQDGTLFRANKQTGQIDPVGNFGKGQSGGDGGDEWGLNVVWGQDGEGNTVVGQVSKSGKFKPLDTGGFIPTPGISNSDLGTSVVTRNNRTGEVIDTREKDIAGAARERETGEAAGKAIAAAPGDVQAAQNALDLIADLRNDPYRERGTGISSVLSGIPSHGGYDFEQKVEQAKSGAFLTAIEHMRGLGALSNVEGQTATAAITRMKTSMSEEGFLEALADYEKIIQQGLSRAQGRLGQSPAANGNSTASGVKWEIVE